MKLPRLPKFHLHELPRLRVPDLASIPDSLPAGLHGKQPRSAAGARKIDPSQSARTSGPTNRGGGY